MSGLNLINTLGEDDLIFVLDQCTRTFINDTNRTMINDSRDKLDLINILIFSINAFMLEAVKNQMSEVSLIRLLQEHSFDCSTSNFKLFENFIKNNLRKLSHNMNNFELESDLKFRDIEWSQMLNIKSSSLENLKEKNYMIDILVANKTNDTTPMTQSIPICLSEKELQDFYVTIRDCVKNVENYLGRN